MPISMFDLVIAIILVISIPTALMMLARKNKRWAVLAALGFACLFVLGHAIEKVVTGSSVLF